MKDKTTAGILALVLGGLGVHKFYLGDKSGIWYLLFCWTFIPMILALVDAIKLFNMPQDVFDNTYNNGSRFTPPSIDPQYSFLPPILNDSDEEFKNLVFKKYHNTDYFKSPANDGFMRMMDNYLSYMNTLNNSYLEAFKRDEAFFNKLNTAVGDRPINYGEEIHKLYKSKLV